MSLLITHTHAEGTMIEGTSRGDGTAETLKKLGWRWSRNLGSWYVPQTRLVSSSARARRVVNATRTALEMDGFTVVTQVDWNVPEDTLEARIDRQRERVVALEAKVARKTAAEDAAWGREQSAVDRLPWGGEPIKVGHHSEGRHRNAINKAHAAAHVALGATHDREDAVGALEAARHNLAGLEAQRGRVTYTAEMLQGAVAVRDRWGWHRVVRVNAKSVTVATEHSWTGRIPIGQVLEHRAEGVS